MANQGALDTESLELLIRAVSEYQEKVVKHYQVIQNAANLCDQAMGSDEISKKQIDRLNEAASELIATAERAKQMAEELMRDRIKALVPYEMN